MKNVGVFIVGTSPSPIYISIRNYLKESVSKIILLATEDNEYSKGTYIYAERLKKVFCEENIEIVLIDRSNLKIISGKVDAIIEKISEDKGEVSVYLDFTGGTKLQSAFIRERFEEGINYKKDNLNLVYVDGYAKKINIKEKNKLEPNEVMFDNIDGCDDDEKMQEICFLHGYNLDINDEIVQVISEDEKNVFIFDDIIMKNYDLEFICTLKNKLGKKDDGKNKVKLEMFKNIIHSEQIGGSLSIINFQVPEGREENYRKLKDEFLGIKRNIYANRIYFNSK